MTLWTQDRQKTLESLQVAMPIEFTRLPPALDPKLWKPAVLNSMYEGSEQISTGRLQTQITTVKEGNYKMGPETPSLRSSTLRGHEWTRASSMLASSRSASQQVVAWPQALITTPTALSPKHVEFSEHRTFQLSFPTLNARC